MPTKKLAPQDNEPPPPILCQGVSRAFNARYRGEPHAPTRNEFPQCWKCGANLGCDRCSGIEEELLCMNGSGKRAGGGFYGHNGMGPVWATVKAFAKHGLFIDQTLDDYPPHFQRAYEVQRNEQTMPWRVV